MGDNAHLVVCMQKVEGQVQPPTMKLVKYSNDRLKIAKEKDVDKNLLVLNMGMNPSDGGNSMDFDAQGMSPPTGNSGKRNSKKSPRKKAKKKDASSPTPVETAPEQDDEKSDEQGDEKGDE